MLGYSLGRGTRSVITICNSNILSENEKEPMNSWDSTLHTYPRNKRAFKYLFLWCVKWAPQLHTCTDSHTCTHTHAVPKAPSFCLALYQGLAFLFPCVPSSPCFLLCHSCSCSTQCDDTPLSLPPPTAFPGMLTTWGQAHGPAHRAVCPFCDGSSQQLYRFLSSV